MKPLIEEFGDRLTQLHTGALGLRGGMACTVKAADAEHSLDFIGSDETVDRYREVIKQDGWQLESFRANPVIPDCHNYFSVACILGRATSVQVKEGRLHNRVKFAMDNPLGAMAFKMARDGFIPAQSVGFIPLEWQNGVGKDQPARTYTKCELLEISLVVVPANPGAVQGSAFENAFKSGSIQRGDLKACAEFFQKFLSDHPDPAAQGSASGAGVHDAQLLGAARSLLGVLRKS